MNQPSDATTATLSPQASLAELATALPGASRVFQRHNLDFCCHGDVSLREAGNERGLPIEQLLDELRAEQRAGADFEDWRLRTQDELIEHILMAFHEPHRTELPRLMAMAAKVEQVHADKPSCPRGLAALLAQVHEEMEQHMQKEEQILFPALRAGRGRAVLPAIRVMEQEHEDHGANLTRLRALTADYRPPAEACNTWRALYLGLQELERDLMQHIHLENHVLFPRALA